MMTVEEIEARHEAMQFAVLLVRPELGEGVEAVAAYAEAIRKFLMGEKQEG